MSMEFQVAEGASSVVDEKPTVSEMLFTVCDFGRERKKRIQAQREREAELSVPKRIMKKIGRHKGLFAIILALIIAFASVPIMASAMPDDYMIGDGGYIIDYGQTGGGTPGSTGLGSIMDMTTEVLGFNGMLRDATNTLLSGMAYAMSSMADTSGLLKSFDAQIEGIAPLVKAIHKGVAIPLANIVVAVFLVVGLGKLLQSSTRNSAEIDLWSIIWVFICYGGALIFINSSYELCLALYNLFTNGVQVVVDIGKPIASSGTSLATGVPSDVKNAGALLAIFLTTFLAWAIVMVCGLISTFSVLARSIQIYIYTMFMPVSLGFLVSDTSTNIATSMIRKYLALLFTGLILAALFMMMMIACGNMSLTNVNFGEGGDIGQWMTEMLMNLVTLVVFAYCIFKAGSWAQEFVGF